MGINNLARGCVLALVILHEGQLFKLQVLRIRIVGMKTKTPVPRLIWE